MPGVHSLFSATRKDCFRVQSTTFRLFSALITVALLVGLAVVVIVVLQSEPSAAPPFLEPTVTSAVTVNALLQTQALTSTTSSNTLLPFATTIPDASTRAQPTPRVGTSILHPTATPTPITALREPVDLARTPARGWSVYSNGNQVTDLTVINNTIWAATGGGIVAWNRSNNAGVKYTTLDGLVANRTTAVVYCPLPGFGLIFGTDAGLQLYDVASERWTLLNSNNSELHHDDIATLNCSVDHGFLVVGYRQHGLDIFDEESGEWRLINRSNGLQRDLVDAVTVVGDLAQVWVSSGFGISVLTEAGVLFYDQQNTPLETNQINAMASDANGTVWLGARDKVYAINGETWTIYSPSYVLASSFPTGEITGLTLADDGTLWIGSDVGELCKFDLVAVTCDPFFTPTELGLTSGITALFVDNLGRLYVATANDGVRFYDVSSNTSSGSDLNNERWRAFVLPDELSGNQIQALTQDAAGYLWVQTEAGLQQWNPLAATETLLFTDHNSQYAISTITTLAADPVQGLWVGGQNAGYFDGVAWTTFATTDGLVDRRVQALTIDEQARTWFGTQGGLSIWNGDSFFNLTQADGLPSATVKTLVVDGATVWIGTDGGLLRFVDNRLQIFTMATTRLPSNTITALAKAEDGALLIGTDQGLVRFIDTTMSIIPEFEAQAITALAVLPGAAIWVATATQGLRYFNGLRWTDVPGSIVPPAPVVTTLFVDRQGALWIGADGGLLRYVP
jgi:ligand-binding sensor domain-containing protein